MKRWLLACLGAVAIGAIGYALLEVSTPSPAQRLPADPAVPVAVAEAERRAMPVELTTIGRVQTIASVPVRPRIDGVITQVHVQDGQEVKAGDLLFTLDERALRAAVLQAEANLARDRATAANAQQEVARAAPLLPKEFVTKQRMDQLQATLDAALATVKADEAMLEAMRVQLSYATIRAPIDGRLGTINFKIGNTVRPTDSLPLVLLNQMRPIYVGFSVPQIHIDEIRKAMQDGVLRVLASPADDPGRPSEGTVAYIENTVDNQTNTLLVKGSFPNADERLWPGQFVNTTLVLGVEQDAVVVPAKAVQAGQRSPFVFVLKPDSTVEARPVQVARQTEQVAVIAQGIEPGDKVVVDGQLRLDDGTRVKLRTESTAEEPKPPAPKAGRKGGAGNAS